MGAMASQITSLTIVYSTVYSGTDQRKHQSSASLAYVRRIHRWPVNSPHKWPVTRKMFPFDDVIMWRKIRARCNVIYLCITTYWEPLWNFAHSTAVILSWSVQNIRRICWLKWMLWTNESLSYAWISFRRVSDEWLYHYGPKVSWHINYWGACLNKITWRNDISDMYLVNFLSPKTQNCFSSSVSAKETHLY